MPNYQKKIKPALNYVGKILSTTILTILIIVGLFLVYYVISSKIIAPKTGKEPLFGLYTIISPSMVPNINVYDTVLTIRVDKPDEVKVGDVITFISSSSLTDGKTVTHRVAEIKKVDGRYEFITKGDSNATVDSDTAKFSALIGRVSLRIPQLGRIQFFLATKLGWLIVILVPSLFIIIYDVIKLLKMIKTKQSSNKIEATISIKNLKENESQKQVNETLRKIANSDYMKQLDNLKKFNDE